MAVPTKPGAAVCTYAEKLQSPMSNIDHRVLMKDALQKIKHLQTQLETVTQKQSEPIALIGMACRFPGQSNTPEQFWQILTQGVDAVRPMPADRRAFPEHAQDHGSE